MHVRLIGHSISWRLRHHLFPTPNNSSILPLPAANPYSNQCTGGGAKLVGPKSILFHHHIQSIPQGTQVVLFSIGTNDLCAGAQPGAVAALLYFHALGCLNQFGVQLVLIDQIFPRATSLYPGFTALEAQRLPT